MTPQEMVRTLSQVSKATRGRYEALSPQARAFCVLEAATLYDGTRTVARCWTEALDTTETLPRIIR